MIGAWLLAACVAWQGPPASESAADRVALKDGRTLLGLVTSPAAGPRVGFDMLVRRSWAEAHVPDLAERWVRNAETVSKPAVAERRRRLRAWRAERAAAVGEDRATAWIDAELKRLDDPATLDAPLLAVRIGRDGCRSVERAGDADRRLLALAWTCGLPDPEEKSPEQLREAVEARGFFAGGGDFPSLDKMTPIVAEPESKWLARRAATEVSIDPGRRFIRYQGLVLPEPSGGAKLDDQLDLGAVLGGIGRLLDPAPGETYPLAPALSKIGREGGVGAVVTRLEIAPDLTGVAVDVALWVRGPGGWVEYGSRRALARMEDVAAADADAIGRDPQARAAFDAVEALGLGAVTAEIKDRSLRAGSATARALGSARAGFARELSALAFPVLEGPPAR